MSAVVMPPTVERLVRDLRDCYGRNAPNIAAQRVAGYAEEAERLRIEAARLRALAVATDLRAKLAEEYADLYAHAELELTGGEA